METNTLVTCLGVGIQRNALTRGLMYERFDHGERPGLIRVRSNQGRIRWYSASFFDPDGGPAATLASWRFGDPVCVPAFWDGYEFVEARDETCNCVDLFMKLSDGTTRYLMLATPDFLKRWLEPLSGRVSWGAPAIWSSHLVVIHDLREETVEHTLHYIDQQGELEAHPWPSILMRIRMMRKSPTRAHPWTSAVTRWRR